MAGVRKGLQVFPGVETLNRAAAGLFAATALQATKERGRFLVCLSGGRTPRGLYQLLSEEPQRSQVPWQDCHVFWGDERCVPASDPRSNYMMAWEVLLGHVPIPADHIHRFRTELGPEPAAADYAQCLSQYAEPPLEWPRFDLAILGLGEDGHTASLFPGSLPAGHGPAAAVNAPDSVSPRTRITLMPRVFRACRRLVFLVHGRKKAQAVARVLGKGTRVDVVPVRLVLPDDGETLWMLDSEAAALLESSNAEAQ